MAQQIPLGPHDRAGEPGGGASVEIAPDLAYRRLAIINVMLVGERGAG